MRNLKIVPLLALLTLCLLPALAWGQPTSSTRKVTVVAYVYDVDSLSYYYPVFCTPTSGSSVGACNGPGKQESGKITTSGSTTTITTVNTDGVLRDLSVGDMIFVSVPAQAGGTTSATQYVRKVTNVSSADSIDVDTALTLPAAGVGYTWWKAMNGSASTSGWFDVASANGTTLQIQVGQISATGGITYSVDCGIAPFPGVLSPPMTYDTVATAAITTTGTTTIAIAEPYTVCRVGLKITTADDDGITISAADNKIDFLEYQDSFTVGASDDIDFTEDPSGAAKVCTASLSHLQRTGDATCTALAAAMNSAACTPDNTYSCTFSHTTHKFTIARATGSKDVSLLWQTGANTATSLKTLLGFANLDDTGGTSYVSDSAVGGVTTVGTLTNTLYGSGTELCAEVVTQMEAAANAAGQYTCTVGKYDGFVTISATGIDELQLLWNSGANNAAAADTPLGFAADLTGAVTYTAPVELAFDTDPTKTEKVNVALVQR